MTRDKTAALTAECDKLQAFKDWVHAYLDGHGVPHHPPGTHGAAGCRIGDRMDWLMQRHAALRAAVMTAATDIRQWIKLAEHQRVRLDQNLGWCPTQAGIDASMAVLEKIAAALNDSTKGGAA